LLVTEVPGPVLKHECCLIAAAALLARNYPEKNCRHDAALLLGGFFHRCGLGLPVIKLMVESIGVASRQSRDKIKDMIRAAEDAGKAAACGRARLRQVFGEPVADKVCEWLGFRPSTAYYMDPGDEPGGRVSFPVPRADDELTPVMRLLDEQLMTGEPEPPMRSLMGWPVEVQLCEPMGMHELTAAGANDNEDEKRRLPAPKAPMFAPHDATSMALQIERYVRFTKESKTKDGNKTVTKRLPPGFVISYLAFKQSKLPRVSTIMTMPVVLPNGEPLATNGLDRKRKIFFHIEPEILELLPCGHIPVAAVESALRFLTDDWLVDVQTDYPHKCVLIALALTVLERELFGERPAFIITAGKRGGGKTTVINMINLALTGKRAAATAFSPSEEERRKSLFAALLQNVPLICWDNIKLGTAISCPHIEKVLTSTELKDRVLGESREERVSCAAILTFTGNNITAKGDMASRCLVARINVDRPDPENREFKHPDPFAWTLDHRGEIIEALYTILLGNPRLHKKPKDRSPEKTRFKAWWHLVGSAIEYAAGLCVEKPPVDFQQLFLTVEGEDEETASLAEVLQCADKLAGGKEFGAAKISKWMTEDPESEDAKVLKDFFASRDGIPSTRTITAKLRNYADSPVWVGQGIWSLKKGVDKHTKTVEFHIEKKA
jgi:hypothetical protein